MGRLAFPRTLNKTPASRTLPNTSPLARANYGDARVVVTMPSTTIISNNPDPDTPPQGSAVLRKTLGASNLTNTSPSIYNTAPPLSPPDSPRLAENSVTTTGPSVQVFVVTAPGYKKYRDRFLANAAGWHRGFPDLKVFTFDEIPSDLSFEVHQIQKFDLKRVPNAATCCWQPLVPFINAIRTQTSIY